MEYPNGDEQRKILYIQSRYYYGHFDICLSYVWTRRRRFLSKSLPIEAIFKCPYSSLESILDDYYSIIIQILYLRPKTYSTISEALDNSTGSMRLEDWMVIDPLKPVSNIQKTIKYSTSFNSLEANSWVGEIKPSQERRLKNSM